MLNFCSSFYKDIAYFGGYPSQMEFKSLIDHGFKYFIDLTTIRERQKLSYDYSIDISNYKDVFYINYSIIDNNIPISKDSFMNFLSFLMKIFKKKDKIYIHCKGGHGRSSLLVASIFCFLLMYNPYEAFHKTKQCHERRDNLKEKYRGIDCPQVSAQRKFVICLYNDYKNCTDTI